VNVTVETLGPCKKLVRVEIDAAAVEAAFERATSDVQKQARLPGFRPGKTPRHLVVKSFARDIEEQVRRRLTGETFRKALEQEKIRSVATTNFEEIQFGRGQSMQYAATVETAPDFQVPEYKGLSVQREMRQVTDEDVAKAIDMLRDQRAGFNDVSRAVQDGDFVVVNYTGTTDGQPLTDFAPTARGLTQRQGSWMPVAKDSFIPGFTEQLLGAVAGEKRTVNVDFPADFVAPQLAGREGVYEVEVTQVKEKVLPAADDEFAKGFGAQSLEQLTAGVRRDLETELKSKLKRSVRDQILRGLLSQVTFDLPESMVTSETRNVVYDIVNENQQRGIPKDAIDSQKDQIFNYANASAKDRLKAGFIMNAIAEREAIKVEEKEVLQRVVAMADHYQMKPEKMLRQLQERNGLDQIAEQIVTAKVLDFLELHAKVEDVLPTTTPA
jgi:trigger factor